MADALTVECGYLTGLILEIMNYVRVITLTTLALVLASMAILGGIALVIVEKNTSRQ